LLSDLHMKNVLVMQRCYDDSQFPTEFKHMVSDFGNSKQTDVKLDKQTTVSSFEQLRKDSLAASRDKG
jgi:hypothetical protein